MKNLKTLAALGAAAVAATTWIAVAAPANATPSTAAQTAVAPRYDYIGSYEAYKNSENARVGVRYRLYRDNMYASRPYVWKLVWDRKWNVSGGSVTFVSVALNGQALPGKTIPNLATHCWFPEPPYSGQGTGTCAPRTNTTTLFNYGPTSREYVAIIRGPDGSRSCTHIRWDYARVAPCG